MQTLDITHENTQPVNNKSVSFCLDDFICFLWNILFMDRGFQSRLLQILSMWVALKIYVFQRRIIADEYILPATPIIISLVGHFDREIYYMLIREISNII